MITRVLPREDYGRLAGTELETVAPVLPPDAEVLVAEDAGVIVGCWAVFAVLHVEGIWIAPSHRKQGGVARRLLRGMRGLLERRGAAGAVTGAMTDDVRGFLERLGARRIPGEQFAILFGRR